MEKAKFVDTKASKTIADLLRKQNHRIAVLWATDCAKHVLPIFEKNYSKDSRPREAIEAGRAWTRGELTVSEARKAAFASHAAARESNKNSACAAARAAGHAAATVHVAKHAEHAASYATKAVFYASDPNNAETTTAQEREWQLLKLLSLEQRE